MCRASSAFDGSVTTTVAVVPRARMDLAVKECCLDATADLLIATYRLR
jgi:hypothetical protein